MPTFQLEACPITLRVPDTTTFTHEPIKVPALSFFIAGHPGPAGSKRGFALKKGGKYTGKVAMIDSGGERTRNWKQLCVSFAWEVAPKELFRVPIKVDFDFVMPRPKYHFHTSKKKLGQLREDAPTWHSSEPDTSKLVRSTEDSLTGVLWTDDSLICSSSATKCYGDKPGCRVTVTMM